MNEPMTPSELDRRGMQVLIRELGFADAMRFLARLRPGKGNYTKERRRLLAGVTLDDLLGRSRQRLRKSGTAARRRKRSA